MLGTGGRGIVFRQISALEAVACFLHLFRRQGEVADGSRYGWLALLQLYERLCALGIAKISSLPVSGGICLHHIGYEITLQCPVADGLLQVAEGLLRTWPLPFLAGYNLTVEDASRSTAIIYKYVWVESLNVSYPVERQQPVGRRTVLADDRISGSKVVDPKLHGRELSRSKDERQ